MRPVSTVNDNEKLTRVMRSVWRGRLKTTEIEWEGWHGFGRVY
jgi:hypothetical protein